jgi:alanine racemase
MTDRAGINRRHFIASGATIAGSLAAGPAFSETQASGASGREPDPGSFDPWVEVIADAIRHNVREIHRYTSGCPLLAVVKNNANGIGLRQIGPILDGLAEVRGLAVARVDEALSLRQAGVKKPILIMAHASEAEAAELVRHDVRLTLFHDDARQQVERLAARLKRPIPVHLKIDTGMNRIGLPVARALPWIAEIAASKAARIEGTWTMFSGAVREGKEFDREHLRRFLEVVEQAKAKGIALGLLHGAPSTQIIRLPEAHKLDLVRPGGAIYGLAAYRHDPAGNPAMDLQPVFRLRARVARVERLNAGDGVSFNHRYVATKPTWVATIPIGHTDGYPREAAGKCFALIGGALYPLIGVVSSNHTIAEIGADQKVTVGDVATLVGPDHPDIDPKAVATQTGLDRDYWIMTKLNALLHRRVV